MDEQFREALRRLGYGAQKIADLEYRAADLSLQKGISEERARAIIFMVAKVHSCRKHSARSSALNRYN